MVLSLNFAFTSDPRTSFSSCL